MTNSINGVDNALSYTCTGNTKLNTEHLKDVHPSIFNTEEDTSLAQKAQDKKINTAIKNFSENLEQRCEDKALESYEDLINYMKDDPNYASIKEDSEALREIARELIEKKLSEKYGEDINLEDYIIKYAANFGENQWQHECAMFNTDRIDTITEEDLLNEICGKKVDKRMNEQSGIVNFLAYAPGVFVSLFNKITGPAHY